ncbi:hypothetical protein [Helicobacter labetoulli]|uniref:hypothetical protein n=1 Tax=Helicobacter labetoulli TaxID=2315333 RepID=UPI000EF71EB3|nr:hypothetical protein [Helicobacter labetoulli]
MIDELRAINKLQGDLERFQTIQMEPGLVFDKDKRAFEEKNFIYDTKGNRHLVKKIDLDFDKKTMDFLIEGMTESITYGLMLLSEPPEKYNITTGLSLEGVNASKEFDTSKVTEHAECSPLSYKQYVRSSYANNRYLIEKILWLEDDLVDLGLRPVGKEPIVVRFRVV